MNDNNVNKVQCKLYDCRKFVVWYEGNKQKYNSYDMELLIEFFKFLIHMQNDSSFQDFEKEMFVECDETCVLFVANKS